MPTEKTIIEKVIYGAPEGLDGRAVARHAVVRAPLIWIVRDESRLARAHMSLAFFLGEHRLNVIEVPAFDCLPYDRFSPSPVIAARRAAGLSSIARAQADIVLISLNGVMQRVPPHDVMAALYMELCVGATIGFEVLRRFLERSGYRHVDVVAAAGDYALRGGLIDVYPAGSSSNSSASHHAVRIDFFGDEIEDMRLFDVESQRSAGKIKRVDLYPASEVQMTEATIRNFKTSYTEKFGFARARDDLYAGLVDGQRVKGMEHFMPLFYPQMETLFDYMPDAAIVLDEGVAALFDERWSTILACHQGRVQDQNLTGRKALHSVYHPLPPEDVYLDRPAWEKCLSLRARVQLSSFVLDDPDAENEGGRSGCDFTEARKRSDLVLMDEVAKQIQLLQKQGRRILLAAQNPAQHKRLVKLLEKHHGQEQELGAIRPVSNWREAQKCAPDELAAITLDIARGIATEEFVILCEEDIIGARPVRARQRGTKRARAQLMQGQAIHPGDLVVHADHGIGRFTRLRRVQAAGAAHDCLMIVYANDGRLFIPVENADLISRYGAAEGEVALDRLGTHAWAQRKERIQKKLWEMAGQLIKLAAARQTAQLSPSLPPQGLYEEFCARFAFEETEDQSQAIQDVMNDLSCGRPMDRLICGDVGFGKTEVALRGAFVSVMAGHQVAIIAPTTLLCRQHVNVFTQRFEGFPVRIGHLSRLTQSEAAATRAGLADGTIDIAIGTHALLSAGVKFRNLGLAVIDEEQHFGVGHKERLKEIREEAHILTLTATPIPRTLQMALSGAREISLIGDPPAGRLAVHNFIGMFDPPTIRMALLREHERGGRSFFICPRVRDLEAATAFLSDYVPELNFVVAHGRLPPSTLEEQIGAFYDGAAHVLLSTNIVEAGLDISDANTLIVWHAHMFGLAQLHQLRGRVGRSKMRAYAYFTLPASAALTAAAEERLRALNQMDQLGAGFALAARDLDIRGAGNLLGKDQSGHIREIGYELYQKMLADAVAQRKAAASSEEEKEDEWSPRVKISAPIMIPEDYIPDMKLRLALYRDVASIKTDEEMDLLIEEIKDRFGAIPAALQFLFEVVRLKTACRAASVDVLEIGQNGVRLGFYRNQVANLTGLVQFIESQKDHARLLPDHRLLIKTNWPDVKDQFHGAHEILVKLKEINQTGEDIP